MRIDRVRIEHFGGLKHIDTGPDPLGRIAVVYGPNESGKSTLFNFTRAMLYGFAPASRAKNPYAPWSGADIEGHVDGHLDDGGAFQLRRRLRSSPWGRLKIDDEEVELRNRPAPFAKHVPADVYRKIFTLTLDELAGLDASTWGDIQNRLLASLVLDDLYPPREVADRIFADGRTLWRPDRRGQPRDRQITEQVRTLQAERREAAERDQQLRRSQAELEDTLDRLEALKEKRTQALALSRQLERVQPASRRLERLLEARSSAVLAAEFADIPDEPSRVLEQLKDEGARFGREVGELDRRERGLARVIDAFGEADRQLSDAADRLRAHTGDFEAIPVAAARLEAARADSEQAVHQLGEAKDALFGDAAGDVADATLAELAVGDIDAAVRRLEALRGEAAVASAAAVPEAPTARVQATLPATIALVAGAGLIGLASFSGGIVAAAVGGALLLFAMLALGIAWDRRRRGDASKGPDPHAVERRAKEAVARATLDELLRPLPLLDSWRSDPGPRLAARLRELATLGARVAAATEGAHQARGELERLESLVGPILVEAGLSPGVRPVELFASLASAERRRDAAREARTELEAIERSRRDAHTEQTSAMTVRQSLVVRLTAVGSGSVSQGLDIVETSRRAARRATDLEREFEREFGDADEVADAVDAFRQSYPDVPLTTESVTQARLEVEEHSRRIETESGRVQRLEADVDHMRGGDSPAAIDGRIASLTQERTALRRERDRLELLGRIVEEAERRFRARHQPDVLRRGAEYLSRITDGRYKRLLAANEGPGGVVGLESVEGRPLGLNAPLSRGTKEQVLLSLRLAAADHLDSGGERLPLFIDEVFVNWDRSRRDRGLEILTELSRSRQVFVFTCHADVAERLVRLGGRVFELPRS